MKILGGTNTNDYIVQLTGEELANVLGFHSNYDQNFTSLIKVLPEGESVNISSIYKKYYQIATLLESPERDKAVTKLRGMIEALTPIDDLLCKLKKEYETDKI